MIDGHTTLVGLIGWPVEHSLSPAMHNAAFEALGLNWCYVPLPVPPGQIEAAVEGLAALGFRGANVTVPHKQGVMPALASAGPSARALGAANTLIVALREDGTPLVTGYNTDAKGFVGALRRGGFEPEDDEAAVVVGAGGAARAVVLASSVQVRDTSRYSTAHQSEHKASSPTWVTTPIGQPDCDRCR